MDTFEHTLSCVGVHFHQGIESVKRGDKVILVAEDTNPVDPNAVRVDTADGIKIGYIPKDQAPILRRWIVMDKEIEPLNPTITTTARDRFRNTLGIDIVIEYKSGNEDVIRNHLERPLRKIKSKFQRAMNSKMWEDAEAERDARLDQTKTVLKPKRDAEDTAGPETIKKQKK